MSGLSLGAVKCIRVDKEVDEQGLLPYKLLTVPFSKHHEMALSAAETSITAASTPSATDATVDQTNSSVSASKVSVETTLPTSGAALIEEQQAYQSLLPYVLTPAQLHLWDYPTEKLVSSANSIDSNVDVVAGSADEQPAKRARVDTSVHVTHTTTDSAIVGVTQGLELLPSITEAQQVLSQLTSTGWVKSTTNTPNSSTLLIGAIDCEMCDTCNGMELTRVSVLTYEGIAVLDTLVKPKDAITNYRTQFSGISEELLRDVTVTLEQVYTIIWS